MAILRNTPNVDYPIEYAASAAFFCCVSMVVLGLFGFYAKIKVASKRTNDEDVPVVCISGAYRLKREDFFESGNVPEPPKKITPSMVRLPLNGSLKTSKSTNDMREPEYAAVMLNKSTPDISMNPRGGNNNNADVELRNPQAQKREDKDKKKLDKKRRDEQKAREKAAQELAKKQAKEKAKQEKEQAKQAKARDKKGKTKAPPLPQFTPPQTSIAPPPPRQPLAPANSFQSDINRNSGPPPYSELPENKPPQASTSNVSFGKPIDNTPSSWDLVSQHRQQMSRPTATIGGSKKQMVMDLQYNNFNNNDKDNSEA